MENWPSEYRVGKEGTVEKSMGSGKKGRQCWDENVADTLDFPLSRHEEKMSRFVLPVIDAKTVLNREFNL